MKNECPYGADTCPQVERLEKSVDVLTSKLDNITRIMYIMCGIIAVQLGVLII